MTIEERVDEIGEWRNPDARNWAIQVMRAAVKAAIAEERDACAKIADELSGERSLGEDIGDAIRARSNASGETK